MYTLILFRHAKSSWDNPDCADIDRPLNGRGRRAAPAMGKYLISAGLKPDLILCSPACRTRETAKLALEAMGCSTELRYVDGLYLADAARMASLIQETPVVLQKLMLIGHNPGLQDLALELVGKGPSELIGPLEAKFPTGAIAVITLPCKAWRDVGPGSGTLKSFVTPRDLGV